MAPCLAHPCCSIVKWFPVAFISAIAIWSYFAYVVELCLFTVDSVAEKGVLLLLLYHLFFLIFVSSYWQTIFRNPGSVPNSFFLQSSVAERLKSEVNEDIQRDILNNVARNLPVQNRTISGFPRYCEKCECIKPDRCHHCSVCNRCVLKMDHHCPWVNNCVGFANYKFFILFLGYGLLYCLYVALTSLKYFVHFWVSGTGSHGVANFQVLFLFFMAFMFGISLVSLLCYHIYLVCKNRSTLESFRAAVFQTGPDKDGFHLGVTANLREVFGNNIMFCFLPVFSSLGDGVSFRSRLQPGVSYDTMGHTPSLGDGVTYPTRTVDNDGDTLLGERQRWMEEGGFENSSVNVNHAADLA